MARPMLDDVELQQVQKIEVDEDQVLIQHGVPALEGDFLQRLNRRATQVTLTGVLTGPEVGEGLKTLREKFRAAEPVPFVADMTTATQVDQVLIEEMGVRELAGKPERFEYALTLREFIVPPEVITEEPPEPDVPEPPDDDIDQNVGTLIGEVIVEGQPSFDFSRVTVTVQGTTQDGEDLSRTLTSREGNIWTEEGIPASRGEYTVAAVVTGPPAMSGSARTAVRAGQTAKVTITLRTGVNIATAFIVHFWFDNAFIEPCMRSVMREVAAYAQSHPDEKLLIVGHTDKVGPPNYNQPLSERRARSAYAYLTYGRDPAAAAVEWDQLRRKRTTRRSINDTWGAREYQYILQDLGYYPHNITEEHDDETDAAVRQFQGDKGLAVDGKVGDHTWLALINAYLGQDSFAIPESQFLPNARDGCDGGILKWLGCGEEDPVDTRGTAWRPNRCTEFLFVKDDTLPCNVPEPKTFDLPPLDGAGPTWCLDGGGDGRCCFVTPAKENVCPQEGEKWCRQPVDPRKIRVSGSVKFEDGTPLANAGYILIAPDGEYLHKDGEGNPDLGEVPSGEKRGRPNPIHNRTDDEGLFSFPKETPVGVYVLELVGRFVARLEGEPPEAAKGNVVCKRLDGASDFDVIVSPGEEGDPRRKLRVTIHDHFGGMRRQTQVEVRFNDGGVVSAITDDEGEFTIDMNVPYETAKIYYQVSDEDPSDVVYYADFFIDVKDINTEEGIRRRLHNLGYLVDDDLPGALTAFQATYGLDTTGEVDDETRDKLVAVHDGDDPLLPELDFTEEPLSPNDLTEEGPPI